jgi:hypothetical protein
MSENDENEVPSEAAVLDVDAAPPAGAGQDAQGKIGRDPYGFVMNNPDAPGSAEEIVGS